MKLNIEYRGCYIYTDVYRRFEDNYDSTPTFIAYIHDNGTCYGEEISYISEEKVIEKAKKFIDELLEDEL